MSEHRFVVHVDLLTGDTKRCLRSEVEDAVVGRMRAMFDSARRVDRPRVPGLEATVRVRDNGRCVNVTISALDGLAVGTVSIGGHARCSDKHWQELHLGTDLDLPTLGRKAPSAPWCAVLPEKGRDKHPALLDAIQTLGPAVAWGWLERGGS